MPRKEGMERWRNISFQSFIQIFRKDLLALNVKIFKVQGQALDQFAKKTCKILVSWSNTRSWVKAFVCVGFMGLDSGGGEPCQHQRADLLSLCSVHPKGLVIIAISPKIIRNCFAGELLSHDQAWPEQSRRSDCREGNLVFNNLKLQSDRVFAFRHYVCFHFSWEFPFLLWRR